MRTSTDTVQKIMAVAQELVQSRGYNDFSFHDIARKLGIKSASIHYYFPAKSDLGKSLVQHYHQNFINDLNQIDAISTSTMDKVNSFTNLFFNILESDNRMCLCGMFASDITSMPAEIQAEVRIFFTECEKWLAAIIRVGQQSGEIGINHQPENLARFVFASLEGAMLSARTFADAERFKSITDQIISAIKKT
jgi:TetR/AcrR family transcriptional repressor of nem operon